MKPIYIYLLIITLAIIMSLGSFFWGKSTVICPKYDAPVIIPNDTIRVLKIEISELKKQLKKKKYEIIVKVDTLKISPDTSYIPAVFSEWAKYYGI